MEAPLLEDYYRNYSAVRADFQSLHHYPIFARRNSQKLAQWSVRKKIVQNIYTPTVDSGNSELDFVTNFVY